MGIFCNVFYEDCVCLSFPYTGVGKGARSRAGPDTGNRRLAVSGLWRQWQSQSPGHLVPSTKRPRMAPARREPAGWAQPESRELSLAGLWVTQTGWAEPLCSPQINRLGGKNRSLRAPPPRSCRSYR
ncbi:unnamed protein product [Caretta caretta]